MRNFILTTSDYAKNTPEQSAVIALRPDGFSFLIRTQPHSIAAVGYVSTAAAPQSAQYEQELRRFLQQELLQQSFAQCSILYAAQAVSMVPGEFYSEQHRTEVFTLTQALESGETVAQQALRGVDAVVLYALPQNSVNTCNEELHRECRFFPQAASFIERSVAHNTLVRRKMLSISVESFYFDIVLAENGKLLFYNNFSFTNVNEFVHIVRMVCEQLQLVPQDVEIELSGKISAASNYCKSLQLFFPHAQVVQQLNNDIDFSFNPLLFSVFTNLISLQLCE
ncbi:MAG: DUF3822 family protein [Bacteroidales bacterium]|jgi:hypothetical protein|nr:DUF3822 family protein [Bacteroidales bacterium]